MVYLHDMDSTIRLRWSRRVAATLIAVAGLVLLFVVARNALDAGEIRWWPQAVEIELGPGNTGTDSVTLQSTRRLRNASIESSPVLAPFLSVKPSRIDALPPGTPIQIELTANMSSEQWNGRIEGQVYVRSGDRVVRELLHVAIDMATRSPAVSKWISTDYPPLAFEATFVGFSTIGDARFADHAFILVGDPTRGVGEADPPVLLLARRRSIDTGDQAAVWRIIGALEVPRTDPPRRFLSYGLCGLVRADIATPKDQNDIALDDEVVAIVTSADGPIHTDVELAWRANRTTGDFESMLPTRVACLAG